MRLSICVPHYKEDWATCHWLFDSIAIQQGIDFDDIEVILVNDGTTCDFDFTKYPFKVKVFNAEHKGVSATRNRAIKEASGDFVCFCDADDMYLNNYGLHLVFSSIAEDPDIVVSTFVEEQKTSDGFRIIRHEKDATFVHGKVFNRKFLIDNNIYFNEALTIHEDGYFCFVAQTLADTKRYVDTPFYMWKWNPNSTVREDQEDYVLKTYDHVMKCRIAIAQEMEKRGYINEFIQVVCKTILDSYYDFNKPSFTNKKNEKLIKEAEKSFKTFYLLFKDTWKEAAVSTKQEIAAFCRNHAAGRGLIMEEITIKDWLQHIVKEVKL